MKSVHLIVSGRVQGVFFRDNTRRKATELGLRGFARNLENGTVEVAAQGDGGKIDELIDFIKKGPGISRVENIQIKYKKLENFINFEIKEMKA